MVSDFLTPPISPQSKSKIEVAKKNGTLFYALEIGASGEDCILDLMDSHYRFTKKLQRVR